MTRRYRRIINANQGRRVVAPKTTLQKLLTCKDLSTSIEYLKEDDKYLSVIESDVSYKGYVIALCECCNEELEFETFGFILDRITSEVFYVAYYWTTTRNCLEHCKEVIDEILNSED